MNDDKVTFSNLIFCAIITEGFITYIKQAFSSEFYLSVILSITFGILISISYKLDIFEKINLKSEVPFIGNILTGILISRGSNYIFDIIKNL